MDIRTDIKNACIFWGIKMAIKVALEHEDGKRAIAVYKDSDLMVHYWLRDNEDEYRVFEIVSHTIKRLSGW